MLFKRIIVREGKDDVTKIFKTNLSLVEVWEMLMKCMNYAPRMVHAKFPKMNASVIEYDDQISGTVRITIKGTPQEKKKMKIFQNALEHYGQFFQDLNHKINELSYKIYAKKREKSIVQKIALLLALNYEEADILKIFHIYSPENFYACLELAIEEGCSFYDMLMELASPQEKLKIALS